MSNPSILPFPSISTRTPSTSSFRIREDLLTKGLLELTYREACNGIGGWSLSVSGEHEALNDLLIPGSGIVINKNSQNDEWFSDVFGSVDRNFAEFSGLTDMTEDGEIQYSRVLTPSSDVYTFTGISDLGLLFRFGFLPNAGDSHWEDSGTIQEVFDNAIQDQVRTSTGPATYRRIPSVDFVDYASLQAGFTEPSVSISSRYGNVGSILSSTAEAENWHISARSQPLSGNTDSEFNKIMFTVKPYRDRNLLLSLANGNVKKIRRIGSTNKVTTAYALGAEAGSAREIEVVDTLTSSHSDSLARIETYLDRRDVATGDTAELQSLATAGLELGSTAYQIEVEDSVNDLQVGDLIKVQIDDTVYEDLLVSEYTVRITPQTYSKVYSIGSSTLEGLQKLVVSSFGELETIDQI